MKLYALIFAVLCTYICSSQTVEPSSSIGEQHLQIELESQYAMEESEHQKITSWSLPGLLFRYGMFNNAELQFAVPITRQRFFVNDELVARNSTFGDIQIGLSANLWKASAIIPEASLMVRAIIPTQDIQVQTIGKLVSLNLMNELSSRLSLNYNIGFLQQTDADSSGFYILNMTYQLQKGLRFFMEQFGDFTMKDLLSHSFNIGVGANLFDNFSADLSYGKGINHTMNYVGVILTWIVKT